MFRLLSPCRLKGHYAEAKELILKSVEIFEGALGPSHPEVAEGLDNLAGVLGNQVKMMHTSAVVLKLLFYSNV